MKTCKRKLHQYPEGIRRCPDCVKLTKKIWKDAHKDHVKSQEKAWHEANSDKHKITKKTWYEINKEQVKAKQKAWYQANKEKLFKYNEASKERRKVTMKTYRVANSDKIKAKNKAWKIVNRGRHNASIRKYQAKKLQATPPWLTPEQLHSIELYYKAAQWVQDILKIPIHVDHIIPLQGEEVSGLHVPWNLQLLTASKNLSKGNKT